MSHLESVSLVLLLSTNHSSRTHNNRYTKCLAVNFCYLGIHDSVVIFRSIVVIAVQVSGQNCAVGNHDIDILKLIARVRELEFSVEKGSMHVCPEGTVERVGKMLFGNFGSCFHYVEESLLQMFWQGLKQTHV